MFFGARLDVTDKARLQACTVTHLAYDSADLSRHRGNPAQSFEIFAAEEQLPVIPELDENTLVLSKVAPRLDGMDSGSRPSTVRELI